MSPDEVALPYCRHDVLLIAMFVGVRLFFLSLPPRYYNRYQYEPPLTQYPFDLDIENCNSYSINYHLIKCLLEDIQMMRAKKNRPEWLVFQLADVIVNIVDNCISNIKNRVYDSSGAHVHRSQTLSNLLNTSADIQLIPTKSRIDKNAIPLTNILKYSI